MNAAENYPTLSNGPFDDCGGSVWILNNNLAPPGKLRAVLPILIERWRVSRRDPHCRLAGTLLFGGVESEFHARAKIKAIVGSRETAGQETTRAKFGSSSICVKSAR